MARIDIPTHDSLYAPWIKVFADVASANTSALGLTTEQATALTDLATAFKASWDNSNEKKAAAKGAVAAKANMRETSEAAFRATAKMINSNANVSTVLKAQLGIGVTPSTPAPLNPPLALMAVPYENGANKLTWSRNGNSPTTSFLIECRMGRSATWNLVGMTTKTKYTHPNQTPGAEITYRITAQRGDHQSLPSNQATLYAPNEDQVVSLKPAA